MIVTGYGIGRVIASHQVQANCHPTTPDLSEFPTAKRAGLADSGRVVSNTETIKKPPDLLQTLLLLTASFLAATLAAVTGFGGAAMLLPVLVIVFGARATADRQV